MTQVVSEQAFTLESSIDLTRPDAKLFTQPDTNAGRTDMSEYALYRSKTQLNLPSTTGARDYRAACCDERFSRDVVSKSAFPLKKRIDLNLMDPITGLLSPAGESFLKVRQRMQSFGKSRLEPQIIVPQNVNSIRTNPEAIDELKYTLAL